MFLENQVFFVLFFILTKENILNKLNIDSSKNNEDVFNEAQEEEDSDTEDEITHGESLTEEKDINTDEKRTSYIPFSTLQKIEKSILQQMFYRESGFKLPFSRFKRIRNLGVLGNCALTLLVFILFLFPFKFFKEELWIKAKNRDIVLAFYSMFADFSFFYYTILQ